MLHVIVGGDAVTRAEKRRSLSAIPFEELTAAVSIEEIAAVAWASTLMGDTHAYFMRSAFSGSAADEEGEGKNKEAAEELRDGLLEIADGLGLSPHLFVFEEEKLGVKILEQLKKAGAKIELLEKAEKKEAFNVFALSDALGKRDRKQTWLLLTRALRQGTAPENIAGILAWKARTMLAAARSADDRIRLGALSRDLVSMYHDSHRGAGDLSLLLERFALTL